MSRTAIGSVTLTDIADGDTPTFSRYYTTTAGLLSEIGDPTTPGTGVTWTVAPTSGVPSTAFWVAERYTVNGVNSSWQRYPVQTKDGGLPFVTYRITRTSPGVPALDSAQWSTDAIEAVEDFTGRDYSTQKEFGYGTVVVITYNISGVITKLFGRFTRSGSTDVWVAPPDDGFIDGDLFVDGTIAAEKIQADAILTNSIRGGQKTTVDSTLPGFYLDRVGSINVGNEDASFQFSAAGGLRITGRDGVQPVSRNTRVQGVSVSLTGVQGFQDVDQRRAGNIQGVAGDRISLPLAIIITTGPTSEHVSAGTHTLTIDSAESPFIPSPGLGGSPTPAIPYYYPSQLVISGVSGPDTLQEIDTVFLAPAANNETVLVLEGDGAENDVITATLAGGAINYTWGTVTPPGLGTTPRPQTLEEAAVSFAAVIDADSTFNGSATSEGPAVVITRGTVFTHTFASTGVTTGSFTRAGMLTTTQPPASTDILTLFTHLGVRRELTGTFEFSWASSAGSGLLRQNEMRDPFGEIDVVSFPSAETLVYESNGLYLGTDAGLGVVTINNAATSLHPHALLTEEGDIETARGNVKSPTSEVTLAGLGTGWFSIRPQGNLGRKINSEDPFFTGDDRISEGVAKAAHFSSIVDVETISSPRAILGYIEADSYTDDGGNVISAATTRAIEARCQRSGGYDFYANGTGTNYGPFTGGHDALVSKDFVGIPGDIVQDTGVVFKNGVSQVITEVGYTTVANKPAVGVLNSDEVGLFFSLEDIAAITESDEEHILENYGITTMNSLGEGQINVCKDGGDISVGDLITTSSRRGKGMKQSDGVIMNYTVAKARENVTWTSGEDDIKMISCIYLCG